MADRVDMSLDDIIKLNKSTNKPQTRGNRPNKRPQQSGNKPAEGANRLRKPGSRPGLVSKGAAAARVSPNKREPTMLHISNLHFNVTNEDVRELFSEVGPVKKAAVHYDKSGRSLGTAEVTLMSRDAAIRAIKNYNNLPLDGRPMNISIVPSSRPQAERSPAKGRLGTGIKAGSGIYKSRPQNKNTRGGPANRGGRPSTTRGGGKPGPQRGQRQPKKQVTAEELDADLESYTMNVD